MGCRASAPSQPHDAKYAPTPAESEQVDSQTAPSKVKVISVKEKKEVSNVEEFTSDDGSTHHITSDKNSGPKASLRRGRSSNTFRPSKTVVISQVPVSQGEVIPHLSQNQFEAHSAKAMVLSCMDFRLLDDIVYFMNKNGYNNNYDQFILAGASLGFNQEKYPIWGEVFNTHLGVAKKLHNISEIICIDHDRCGAYKLFYPEMKPEEEKEYHKKNMLCFEKIMKKQNPDLTIHTYFMHLDGSCEEFKD